MESYHNKRILNCNYIKYPTPFIVCDDYCDNYEELEKTFPDKFLIDSKHTDQSLQLQIDSYHYKNDLWKNFIEYHTSKKYFEKTCFVIRDQLIRWRPRLWEKIKSGNYTYGYCLKEDEQNSKLDISCRFSYIIDTEYMNKNGMPPHVDNQLKLFQLMVYFKHPKDNSSDGNFHTCSVKSDNSICDIIKCNYTQNRFVLLPHTPSGWHFVTPSNRTHYRKMVNVVFKINEKLQEIDSKFFEEKK
jgi:hypothetical protein